MNEYRITKYNPTFRDQSGAYTKVEWTSFTQIGQTFSGVLLTSDEYERVEEAYVQTALSFLRESGLFSMRVAGLKNSQTHPLDFRNDSVLPLDRIGEIIRRILREELWCRLEGGEGFIHFGWDYYMYIGVSGASIEAAPPMPFFFELPTFPSSLPSKAFASLGALPERGGS